MMNNGFHKGDGGRWLARWRGITGDCTIRAIAFLRHNTACNAEEATQCGLCYMWAWAAVATCLEADEEDMHVRLDGHLPGGVSVNVNPHIMDHMQYAPLMARNGKIGRLRADWNTIMTITADTCAFVESSGRKRDTGHSTAIINGTIYDSFDPREDDLSPIRVFVPLAKAADVDMRLREYHAMARKEGQKKAPRGVAGLSGLPPKRTRVMRFPPRHRPADAAECPP